MMKRLKINRTAEVVLIVPLILFLISACRKNDNLYSFETAVVKKGSIINTVTATGTLQADTTVQVGTQVSGVIKKIFVDFNSVVKKGQLLAEIDRTPLLTQVQQAQASLDDSKSEVEFQSATYERYKTLIDKKMVAQADFDQVKYNYDKAKANLKTAQAGYDKAMVNLNYASISSPIDGIVLSRAVDQGQTVAASFSTPTLFSIANTMKSMQVQANVDEADIGQVRNGQPVDFTVDAYPDQTFGGNVKQIRLQPIVTSNVVTYTVIVTAPNPDQKLMPGMTANITVYVQKIDSVLVIPGKALRFTPDAAWLAEYTKNNPPRYKQVGSPAGAAGSTRQPGTNAQEKDQNIDSQTQARKISGKRPTILWVKSGDKIHRARVETGAADGTNTEIKSGLKEGDEVILSMSPASGKSASGSNAPAQSPFMPQRPRGGTR